MSGNTFTKYTKYTVKELESYVANPETCVQKLEWTDLISVLPKYLGDIREGVRACLSSKIGTYDRTVDGIILAYKNTKIISPLSAIRPNSVRVHVKIRVDFYVFRPQSGSVISGTVRYVSKNYISALIYRVFNVSIKFRNQAARLARGTSIKFVIKTHDMKSDIPCIEGELIGSPAAANEDALNGSTKFTPKINGHSSGIKAERASTERSDSDSEEEKFQPKHDEIQPVRTDTQASISNNKQQSKRKRVKLEQVSEEEMHDNDGDEASTLAEKAQPSNLDSAHEEDTERADDDEIEHSIRAILSGFEQELNGTPRTAKKKKKKKKVQDMDSLEAEVLLKFAAKCEEPDSPEASTSRVSEPGSNGIDKVEKPKKRKKKKTLPEEDVDEANFEASIMSSLLKCAAEVSEDDSKNATTPLSSKSARKKSRKSVRFDSTITEASFNTFDTSEQLEISQLVSQALSSTLNDDEYE